MFKGASVIRMLQNLMGKEAFFEGVSKYLKAHIYQNARTDDLWDSLGQVNINKPICDEWTFPSLSFG